MRNNVDVGYRRLLLLKYLEDNFISNKFITIEEICDNVKDDEGNMLYKLNRDPYIHDKCIILSSDVRSINWNSMEGCRIIVKDTKGNVKLCESREEFELWKLKELEPIIKKTIYLNNLKYKVNLDGTVDISSGEEATVLHRD